MLKVIYPVIGKEKILPCYLTGIGISSPEGLVNRENGLVSYQILFTRSGNGIFEIDGKKILTK